MGQKKFKRSRSRNHLRSSRQRKQKRIEFQKLESEILAFLYSLGEPVAMSDIARAVTGKRTLSSEIKDALTQLTKTGAIRRPGKQYFQLGPAAHLYKGTLEQNPRGFGFVQISEAIGSSKPLDRDVFISAGNLGGAVHGDHVLIRRTDSSPGRPEGIILSVLERGPETIAGFFTLERKGAFVYPEDYRYPFIIEVSREKYGDIESGTAVIASFSSVPASSRFAQGTIVEILGSPENIDVQMRLVIEKHRLPHVFTKEAVDEALALPDLLPQEDDREDLRELQLVTIDGETAKDFDDAICVLRTQHGYRLIVSIADVSYYVKPGSAIDKDAYQRGTSIYFPGRVIPMLPEKLSNNLCSLIPGEDRFAVSAILDFDPEGNRIGKRFCRSIIRSHKRFTYTLVKHILIDHEPSAREENQAFLEMLSNASELAKALLAQRVDRGSIAFSIPEPEIDLDSSGKISSIKRSERNFAHQIIEEFMLAANEAVAETFTRNNRKSLYRIHELPDYEKVVEFSHFAKTLDLQLPPPQTSPEWFGRVLELCKDTPKEYIVNNLLLRTMQQARYSSENVGHFALAAKDYTHFTSPIRRYPDLLVHRELCTMLLEQKKKVIIKRRENEAISEQGTFLSSRERVAITAEREMNDRLKLIYMERHMEEPFTAIISGVSEFAIFVELYDLFISGGIPLESLKDDYYLHDSKHHRIVGEISGKIYQIGDVITVCATDIDKNKNRVNFLPCSLQ